MRGFWCDGVVAALPASYYSPLDVRDHSQVSLRVYAGKDGQTEYRLILKFGKEALNHYAKGEDISDCLPAPSDGHAVSMDSTERIITLQLK